MRKTNLLLLLSLSLATLATAQKQETIANSVKIKGGFGSPYFLFSQADGRAGGGIGGGGAFILNDFFVGAYVQSESFGQRRYSGRDYILGLNSGGFWLGYVPNSYKVVHLYSSLKIGWGSALLRRDDNDPYDNDDIRDAVFVLAPEIGAEFNVLRWFRIGLTGGYRAVGLLNTLPGYSYNDFNSPTLALTFRFGKFGYE